LDRPSRGGRTDGLDRHDVTQEGRQIGEIAVEAENLLHRSLDGDRRLGHVLALPGSKRGLPSTAWKLKSPAKSVKRTPTAADLLSEAAALRPASLVSNR